MDGIEDTAAAGEGTAGDGAAERRADEERRGDLERSAIAALEAILLAGGPLTLDELAEAFAAGSPQLAADLAPHAPGADLAAAIAVLARGAEEFWRLSDGRLAPVLHHLRRSTFTHRLTASELEREVVDLSPDLVALALPRSFSLREGVEVRTVRPGEDTRAAEEESLLGPPGWLASFSAGDLLAVRFDGEQVQFERLPGPGLDDEAGRTVSQALRQTFDELPRARAPETHRLVVDTMGRHPASFAVPVAPLSELLAAGGLRVREVWVGPADSLWATPAEEARRRRLDELLAGADRCCTRSARRALEAWLAWQAAGAGAELPDPAEASRLAEDIGHGPTAALLAEVSTLALRPTVSVALGAWAAAVAAGAEKAGAEKAGAGVDYLRAVGADAAGDALAAEAHLHAGLVVAPDHPACLGYLAELVADRGDAPRALALLGQAGRPPGPEAMRELEPFLVSRQVGRNEPCPCGSGRKLKVCCAGRPLRRPLRDRCRWLLGRATRRAARTDPLALQSLQRLFRDAAGQDAAGEEQALALALDMLLFANGGLARYLDGRGVLLPEDELAAARAWVGRPMCLLEIQGPAPGGSVGAVDLRSGESLTIDDPLGALGVAAMGDGGAVLARPLPVEGAWLLTSALVRVPSTCRDRALGLLEADLRPFQLLELLVDIQVDAIRLTS